MDVHEGVDSVRLFMEPDVVVKLAVFESASSLFLLLEVEAVGVIVHLRGVENGIHERVEDAFDSVGGATPRYEVWV